VRISPIANDHGNGCFPANMRVLFITATRVGDAVLSTGLLDHLVRKYPDARFTIACGPAAAGLFEAVPNLERLIVLDKMPMSLHWVRMWAMCAGRYWSKVVDLRNAPLSYLLPSFDQNHLGRRDNSVHRIKHLARVLGLEEMPPQPKIWAGENNRRRAAEMIPDGGPVLAIGPTANWAVKTWRAERFAELVERIGASDGLLPGCRVALFGRDDERPQVLGLIEAIPEARRLDFVRQGELLDVYACLERCSLYVGNDSGLMHIAAASGIPTLGLFGPTLENLYAPWGAHCATVRTPEAYNEIFSEQRDYQNSQDTLMDGLTVDRVEEAVRELWQRLGKEAA
jgi:heptosyltransferase III